MSLLGIPGTISVPSGGNLLSAGTAVRVYCTHLISSGGRSILKLYNGSSASTTTLYLQVTVASATSSNTESCDRGYRFPNGCWIETSANHDTATISLSTEL